ncbi:MAG: zinc ribbon domain-containing protein [Lachnospiraceae bacterium]|nr:zinc ribbon domain-containing protein [Lachnospiraceae bacterium]
MYCHNCGNPLGDGDKFCSACGTPVGDEGKPEQSEEQTELRSQPASEERVVWEESQPVADTHKRNTGLLVAVVIIAGVLTFLVLLISIFIWGGKAEGSLEKWRERYRPYEDLEEEEEPADDEDFWGSYNGDEFDRKGNPDSNRYL